MPQQALGREGGQEGTFILEQEKNSFLKITSGLAGLLRPSQWPSISLSKYLEGGKVSPSSRALRSAGAGVPAPILSHSGCPSCPPQPPRGWSCLAQAAPRGRDFLPPLASDSPSNLGSPSLPRKGRKRGRCYVAVTSPGMCLGRLAWLGSCRRQTGGALVCV